MPSCMAAACWPCSLQIALNKLGDALAAQLGRQRADEAGMHVAKAGRRADQNHQDVAAHSEGHVTGGGRQGRAAGVEGRPWRAGRGGDGGRGEDLLEARLAPSAEDEHARTARVQPELDEEARLPAGSGQW